MSKRPISPEELAEIQRLRQCGYGTRNIAQRVGRDRKTIRRILLEHGLLAETKPLRPAHPGEPPPPSSTPVSPSPPPGKLARFMDAIEERISLGLTGSRILRELKELGYRGGRTILLDYLRAQRGALLRKRKAWRRFETEPGREMQVDWSPFRVEIGGRETTAHALSVLLCYSRKLFCRYYSNERMPTLLEGLTCAFTALGGCAQRGVFDNPATIVLGRIGKDGRPLWNQGFLEFVKHYGFEPFLCDVNDPDRKGKVERPFQYIEADFLRGRKFADWADLNRQHAHWEDTIANKRAHGTTQRIPDEAFEEERPFLVKPPSYPFARFPEETREVGRDCVISVLGTRYSVPAVFAGQTVRIRILTDRFEVLSTRGETVAFHELKDEQKGRLVIDPSHYESLPRSPAGNRAGSRRLEDVLVARFPEAAAFLEGLKLRMKGLASIHLRTLVRLADTFGEAAFLRALKRAEEFRNFNAEAVRRILEREEPLAANDTPAVPGTATGAALTLGDVEQPTFDGFARFDTDPTTGEPEDPSDAA